ncbi:hypothetical protein MNEG_8850 [Monoraphidium neglectum]|uniref:Uncharacterized protein n=1 Tax=Monoraphidium neglectum TaxID=145388 RepID=A0A0D2JIF3_9CHLO|nr:hypothetical protein MNEG_8850 [Monoraphidium neglectum]KIY99112.1 hypothetical protein MNEG_8850 [Monoraphidium neglectum]|eukprot:XP_013898132.1 hypothetical protein MNEG_8850 [Monoraphidium neglectum]
MLGNVLAATNLSSGNERRAAAIGGTLQTLPLRLCSFDGSGGAVALSAPAGLRVEVSRTTGGAGVAVSLRDELGRELAGAHRVGADSLPTPRTNWPPPDRPHPALWRGEAAYAITAFGRDFLTLVSAWSPAPPQLPGLARASGRVAVAGYRTGQRGTAKLLLTPAG